MSNRAALAAVATGLLSLLPASAASAWADGLPRNPVLGPTDVCLPAILLAILVEGAVLLVLGRLAKKPVRSLLVACAPANAITVTALALAVQTGLVASIPAVVVAELLVWLVEAVFLVRWPGTQLAWKDGLLFSLAANVASLLAGAALLSVS